MPFNLPHPEYDLVKSPYPHETPHQISIGLIQMAMTTNVEENIEYAVSRIRQAAQSGANIICLPELFRSQYLCQTEDVAHFDLAEEIPGQTTERAR